MRILGLSFGFHDAGACMLDGDQIEFAGHSERYSKEKNDAWINNELINAAIEGGNPDVIVLHEKAWAKRMRNLLENQPKGNGLKSFIRNLQAFQLRTTGITKHMLALVHLVVILRNVP